MLKCFTLYFRYMGKYWQYNNDYATASECIDAARYFVSLGYEVSITDYDELANCAL